MNEAPPLIEVQRLCKTVRDATGELPILRDVSFALAQRQTAAIVGASGSGKSTLLSLIAGLDVPSSGTVRIAGQDLFAVDEDARAAIRARRLGFVFQNFQLVGGMTALENVMLPLELAGAPRARQQASEMLARVGLAARLGHYPKLLSGGEQQRVALARAFVMRPATLPWPRCASGGWWWKRGGCRRANEQCWQALPGPAPFHARRPVRPGSQGVQPAFFAPSSIA